MECLIEELLMKAQSGDPKAQYRLAQYCVIQGDKTPALEWLNQSAASGYVPARLALQTKKAGRLSHEELSLISLLATVFLEEIVQRPYKQNDLQRLIQKLSNFVKKHFDASCGHMPTSSDPDWLRHLTFEQRILVRMTRSYQVRSFAINFFELFGIAKPSEKMIRMLVLMLRRWMTQLMEY